MYPTRDGYRRILVIDDNPAIHEDFRKILDGMAETSACDELAASLFGTSPDRNPCGTFELDGALQGEEGVAKVVASVRGGRPYGVAFVDVRMPPGWDGVETTERLWQEDPDLQVVICTAYSDYTWSEMFRRIGGGDRLLVLKKPFDNVEVLQLAVALTEKRRLAALARLRVEELETLVEQRAAALRQLSRVDALTGVLNRRAIEDLMTSLCHCHQRGQSLSLVIVDLNDFKSVNKRYGHQAGDEVLKYVADVMRKTARHTDAVGRSNGDEFVMVLPGANQDDAMQIADRLRRTLAHTGIPWHDALLHVTASVGLAAAEHDFDQLYQMAETARDCAQRAGTNNVFAYCDECAAASSA